MLALRVIAAMPHPELRVGDEVPISARLVFVGERRGYHEAPVITLHDSTVTSARSGHCTVAPADGGASVTDHGSDNGTWIARGSAPTLTRTTSKLEPGDELLIGRWRFAVVTARTPAAGR